MQHNTPILNLLTVGLSGSVTRPIYLEYNSRLKELNRIWANENNRYQILQNHKSTVEALLAISIFYRHVMGFMQGATSFYKSVNKKCIGGECAISIGKNVLDKKLIKTNSEEYGKELGPVVYG